MDSTQDLWRSRDFLELVVTRFGARGGSSTPLVNLCNSLDTGNYQLN